MFVNNIYTYVNAHGYSIPVRKTTATETEEEPGNAKIMARRHNKIQKHKEKCQKHKK